MDTFTRPSMVRKVGFAKPDGYGVAEILALLIMLPLLLLDRVNRLYHREFQTITTRTKDALYRPRNQERMLRRRILYGVAKRLHILTRSEPGMANTSTFILDDPANARVRRIIENVSYLFDHGIGKTTLGFNHLVSGYFDAITCTPSISTFMRRRDYGGSRAQNRTKSLARTTPPEIPGAKRVPGARVLCSISQPKAPTWNDEKAKLFKDSRRDRPLKRYIMRV